MPTYIVSRHLNPAYRLPSLYLEFVMWLLRLKDLAKLISNKLRAFGLMVESLIIGIKARATSRVQIIEGPAYRLD